MEKKIALILFVTISLLILTSCESSKNGARILSKSDFSQFGNNPWSGEIPIKKGDFIALDIDVTTQGTAKVIYTQYEFHYNSVNCLSEPQRRTFIDFSDYKSEKLRKYIGQSIRIYGVVKKIDIKRPEHACDEAHVFVILSEEEVDTPK